MFCEERACLCIWRKLEYESDCVFEPVRYILIHLGMPAPVTRSRAEVVAVRGHEMGFEQSTQRNMRAAAQIFIARCGEPPNY